MAGEDEATALGRRRSGRRVTLRSGKTLETRKSGQTDETLVTTWSLLSIGSSVAHFALVTTISGHTAKSHQSLESWLSHVAGLATETRQTRLTTVSRTNGGVGECHARLTLGARKSVHAIDSVPAGVASGSPRSSGTHPSILSGTSGEALLALGASPARLTLVADISEVSLPAHNGISGLTPLSLATNVSLLSLGSNQSMSSIVSRCSGEANIATWSRWAHDLGSTVSNHAVRTILSWWSGRSLLALSSWTTQASIESCITFVSLLRHSGVARWSSGSLVTLEALDSSSSIEASQSWEANVALFALGSQSSDETNLSSFTLGATFTLKTSISSETAIDFTILHIQNATWESHFTFVALQTLFSLQSNKSARSLVTDLTWTSIKANGASFTLDTFGSIGSHFASGALEAMSSIASAIAGHSLGSSHTLLTLLASQTAITTLALQSVATVDSIESRTAWLSLPASWSIEGHGRITSGSTLTLLSGGSTVTNWSCQSGFSVITLDAAVGGHALGSHTTGKSGRSWLALGSWESVSSGIAIRTIITGETFRSELAVGSTRTDVSLPSVVADISLFSNFAGHAGKSADARAARVALETRTAKETTTTREADVALDAVMSILSLQAHLTLLALGAVRSLTSIASGLTLGSGWSN